MFQRQISFLSQNEELSKKLEDAVKTIGHYLILIKDFESIDPNKLKCDLVIVDAEFLLLKKSEIIKDIKRVAIGFPVLVSLYDYSKIKNVIGLISLSDGIIDLETVTTDILRKIIQRFLDPLETGEKFRIHPREKKKLRISWLAEGSSIRRSSEVMNICKGGLFVKEQNITIHKGDVIKFSLGVDGGSEGGRGIGIVRWICTPGMKPLGSGFGIEFVAIEGLNSESSS